MGLARCSATRLGSRLNNRLCSFIWTWLLLSARCACIIIIRHLTSIIVRDCIVILSRFRVPPCTLGGSCWGLGAANPPIGSCINPGDTWGSEHVRVRYYSFEELPVPLGDPASPIHLDMVGVEGQDLDHGTRFIPFVGVVASLVLHLNDGSQGEGLEGMGLTVDVCPSHLVSSG